MAQPPSLLKFVSRRRATETFINQCAYVHKYIPIALPSPLPLTPHPPTLPTCTFGFSTKSNGKGNTFCKALKQFHALKLWKLWKLLQTKGANTQALSGRAKPTLSHPKQENSRTPLPKMRQAPNSVTKSYNAGAANKIVDTPFICRLNLPKCCH